MGPASDLGAHDPPPCGDLTISDEPELLVELHRAGVQESAALRRAIDGLLGVGLHHSAAGSLDRVQRACDSGMGDLTTTVAAPGEDAPDAPRGELPDAGGLRGGVLDGGQLGRGSVLASTHAAVGRVIDQDLVHRAVIHVGRASPHGDPERWRACSTPRRGSRCTSSRPTRRCGPRPTRRSRPRSPATCGRVV